MSLERQEWQDMAVKTCLGKTEAQARPWVVYTCGPMVSLSESKVYSPRQCLYFDYDCLR